MSEFIKLEKNGEQIDVHPLSLANHLELGWKVVIEQPEAVKSVSTETPKAKAEPKAKPGK